MSDDKARKAREARLRRRAKRMSSQACQLKLEKSHTRDPEAPDYGKYRLVAHASKEMPITSVPEGSSIGFKWSTTGAGIAEIVEFASYATVARGAWGDLDDIERHLDEGSFPAATVSAGEPF